MDNSEFRQILDSDESIVETFKPDKFRFIFLGIIGKIFAAIPFIAFGVVWSLLSSSADSSTMECNGGECTEFEIKMFQYIGWIIVGIAILIAIISILTSFVKYNKTVYCYTNKRIIIRSGFIGADFQTLDFSAITAMNVRVDLLDKFVHPNTGTIWFASASSPMMGYQEYRHNSMYPSFSFKNIKNPYEVLRRIKEYSAH